MVQHGASLLLPGPDRLVAEGFVDEPSNTATINSDPNHDGDVLGQLLSVLLSGVCNKDNVGYKIE